MQFHINEAYIEIRNVIKQYLQKDENGDYRVESGRQLPLYLMGPSGIGKTEIVGKVAEELHLGFVSYSMVHHTRQTLLGLPMIQESQAGEDRIQHTEYTMSEVIGAVYCKMEEGYREGVLFLDEANCCPESIQPMLLSFLQSKVLGNCRLPDGWVIVLCGNPPKSIYNKNAREWDGALMDRLRVIRVGTDHVEYMKYCYQKVFHPVVRLYLHLHREDSYVCRRSDTEMELVTYRTWENLSDTLYDYERMGAEVTPLTLNAFVKVDRIVKGLYEIYRFSRLNPEEYDEIVKAMMEDSKDMQVLQRLKNTPVSLLYGITNICFQRMSEEAGKLFAEYRNLKKGTDADPVGHDGETLRKDCRALVEKFQNMLEGLEYVKCDIMLSFYINSVSESMAWRYVLSGSGIMDRYQDRLLFTA